MNISRFNDKVQGWLFDPNRLAATYPGGYWEDQGYNWFGSKSLTFLIISNQFIMIKITTVLVSIGLLFAGGSALAQDEVKE